MELKERQWNLLLRAIEDGNVIPVIGSDLSVAESGGQMSTVQRLVAINVLQNYDIDPQTMTFVRGRELFDAVCRVKATLDAASHSEIYYVVVEETEKIRKSLERNLPEPLRQIAGISDFKLLVTTSCDGLLAAAMRKTCALKEITHAPNLPKSDIADLDSDWQSRSGEATLLYLFGKARSDFFAIHDEDVLEFAHNLLAGGNSVPPRFLDEMRSRNLLLIGCSFPEWLARFFIRLVNRDRLSLKRAHEWLIDDSMPGSDLTVFLKNFSRETDVISNMRPERFVAELYERWSARRGGPVEEQAAKGPDPDASGIIFFVSYSRSTDAPAAQRLFEELKRLGAADRDVWFDRNTLEPGDDFRARIFRGVDQCRYFVPLVSRAADRLQEKFFRREWNRALDRSEAIMGKKFVLPIIVDEGYEPGDYANVPEKWGDTIDYGHAPGGVPDERTLTVLKDLIRAARKTLD